MEYLLLWDYLPVLSVFISVIKSLKQHEEEEEDGK